MHSRKHFLNISDVIYGYEMLIFFLMGCYYDLVLTYLKECDILKKERECAFKYSYSL